MITGWNCRIRFYGQDALSVLQSPQECSDSVRSAILTKKSSRQPAARPVISAALKSRWILAVSVFTQISTQCSKRRTSMLFRLRCRRIFMRSSLLKALKAGLNVLCEKPMAMNVKECRQMMDAAKQSKKLLQIGHCIRFWPEYAATKKIIDSGKYGKVLSATFQRLSLTPTWSWDNWLLDGKRSGGATLDLHIHDADYIQYVFGMPKEVFSRGVKGPSKDFDHIVTNYIYNGKVVTAEGGWVMTPKFGFEMSFNVALEKATIVYNCTQSPAFKICPLKGEVITPKVEAGDGYSIEIAHFVKAISGKAVPKILTPAQSCDSVKLIEAEKKSARSGKKAAIK